MLHDVDIVKLDFLAIHLDREVSLVYLRSGTLREWDPDGILLPHGHELPFPETCENLIDIVLRSVYPGCRELSAAA